MIPGMENARGEVLSHTTKYLLFVKLPDETRKTGVWDVRSRSASETLAQIKWYAPWRQYCLVTAGVDRTEIIFNAECLNAIIDFIGVQMRARRA